MLPQFGEARYFDFANFAFRRRALAVLRAVLLLILPLLVSMAATMDDQIGLEAKLLVADLARVYRFRGRIGNYRRRSYWRTCFLTVGRIVIVVVTHWTLSVTRGRVFLLMIAVA